MIDTTTTTTLIITNSTEKYIHYGFILLISCIVLSLLFNIFIICIKKHRKQKSDMIRSPLITNIISEISTQTDLT